MLSVATRIPGILLALLSAVKLWEGGSLYWLFGFVGAGILVGAL